MMKTINLNEVQETFLIAALERAGYSINDDPSAYGWEEEDFDEDEERVEEEISAFRKLVVDDVLKQLNK